MNQQEKLRFLKKIAKLEDVIEKEEVVKTLKRGIKEKQFAEKESIITTLVEGLKSNETLLKLLLESIQSEVQEVLTTITKRATDNKFNEIESLTHKHALLLETLISFNILPTSTSKEYIQELFNLVKSPSFQNLFYFLMSNPNAQNVTKFKFFFTEPIANLHFLHMLNLYKKQNVIEKETLKSLISFYIKVAQNQKLSTISESAKRSSLPLAIIVLLSNSGIYNSTINTNLGPVKISDIFNIAINNEAQDFLKELKRLDRFNLLYDLLNSIKDNLQNLNIEFAEKILDVLLENIIEFPKEILIDFSSLLGRKKDKYDKAIKQYSEREPYWYKDIVISNLDNENKLLHKETLLFLNSIDNWHKNNEIKKRIKNFLKEQIDQLLDVDEIFNLFKALVEEKEKFNLTYTNKNIGRMLLERLFKSKDEKIAFIYSNINYLLKDEDVELFKSKLIEKLTNNLDKITKDFLENLSEKPEFLIMEEKKLRGVFIKLLDLESSAAFGLFKLLIEINRTKLSKQFIEEIQEKLKDIKENIGSSDNNSEIIGIIAEIIQILHS